MTTFKFDFTNVSEGMPEVESGTYEFVLIDVTRGATQGGTEYLNLRLTIRNDIEQPFKNAVVYTTVWLSTKNPENTMKTINTIGIALQLDGSKQYESVEHALASGKGKPVRAKVKKELSQDGKYTNYNVAPWDWSVTDFPNLQHQFSDNDKEVLADEPQQPSSPFTDAQVTEDDLPF